MSDMTIIGASILDVLVRPADESVFEKGSFPCESIAMSVGGDALNEATILAANNKKVDLISVFGVDECAAYIKNHCDKYGICLDDSTFDSMYATGMNVVLIKEDGSRRFLTNQNGTLRKLSMDHIPSQFHSPILCFASIFVFPFIQDDELECIFKRARNSQMIICADMTKCKNNETISDLSKSLRYIDYLFPNEEEACLFTRKNTIEEAANVLYDAGVKNVIIKAGKKGCYVKNKTYQTYFPTKVVQCVDTTGAGDSFVAGFLKGLSDHKSFEACIKLANSYGSECIQYIGATTWVNSK